MLTQEQAQSGSKPVPAEKVPPLTDAYRKAHKSYILASGLLASWELIGIQPNYEKLGLGPKKPENPLAVPIILCTLVLYLGYKLTIEWLQCDEKRRATKVSKIDYRITHTIAAIAFAVTIDQHAFGGRFVNQIVSWLMISSLIVCLMPTLSWVIYVNLDRLQSLISRMPPMLGAFLYLSPGFPWLVAPAVVFHGIQILILQKRMAHIEEISTIIMGCILGMAISRGAVVLQKKFLPSKSADSPPPVPASYVKAAVSE